MIVLANITIIEGIAVRWVGLDPLVAEENMSIGQSENHDCETH